MDGCITYIRVDPPETQDSFPRNQSTLFLSHNLHYIHVYFNNQQYLDE